MSSGVDKTRLAEIRERLRKGQPVIVRGGEVGVEGEQGSGQGKVAVSPRGWQPAPNGIKIKPHTWGVGRNIPTGRDR